MALSARPVGMPSGPNVSSAHMPSGGRNVASMAFSQIEELSPKGEVFDDPNFSFQGFTNWSDGQRESHQPEPHSSGNFDTTSTTFLHLLSQQQRDVDFNAPGKGNQGPGLQSMVDKAIRAYEGTARTIGDAPYKLGASVSLSL